jgi:GDSL-like Lipase/Acylhydrolase family
MAFTLLHDTFTGTPAANLTGAVPSPRPFGSVAWTDFSAESLAPMVYQAGGSGIQGPTSGGGYSRYDLTGAPANQTITFAIHSSDASAVLLSFYRRVDVGGTNHIEIDFNYGGGTVNLNKVLAGAVTALASPAFAFSTGTVYTCVVTLTTSGGSTAVTVAINGTTVINAFVIADAALQSSAAVVFGAPATIGIGSLLISTPSATALTVTGPSTLTTGTPGTYTATTDLPAPDGGLSLAESATVFAATFSPSPLVFAAGATSGTFTATSSTGGTGVIGGTAPGITVTGQSVSSSAGGSFGVGSIAANGTPGLTTIPLSVTGATPGTGSLHYQWQRKPYGTGSFTNISGATSATLADSGLTNSTSYDYRCNVRDDGSGSGATATSSASTLWPVDNAFLNYTPGDWYTSGSSPAAYAETVRGGAEVAFGFTGTSCTLIQSSTIPSSAIPSWVIDGGTRTKGTLAAVQVIATGLAAGSHTAKFQDLGQGSANDCWTTPVYSIKITGILLDPGASLIAGPSYPTDLLGAFGDSITTGAAAAPDGSGDYFYSYATILGADLSSRPCFNAFSSSGWTVTAGGSDVPPFASAFGNYTSGKARTLTGLYKRVTINLGTNDALQGVSGSGLQGTIAADLAALRTALGPATKIYHFVPFGGFSRADITAAAASYGGTSTTVTGAGTATYRSFANDANYFLCDLGADAQTGITGLGSPTAQSVDGTHPNTATQASLAAKAFALITLIEGSTATGVTVSPSTVTLAGGGTHAFTATVNGTGSPSQSVMWTASAGSINSIGNFTAPTTSLPATVTVAATSVQDPTKSGTSTVTIPAATGGGGGQLSVYYPTPSLSTIYFTITKSPNLSWNGSAFEATTTSDWSSYAITGTDSSGTGNYVGSVPSGIAAGTYSIYGYRQAGGSAASTDTLIGTELNATWNGATLTTGGAGPGNGLTSSGTTLAQATNSTLWGTTDRLAAANSFSAKVQAYLGMPRQGQAQQFWDGFEQLATSYLGGVPVDASDTLTRLTDYATALNAQAEVANEIVALVAANPGTLNTTIDSTGTAANTVRTFP